MTKLFVAIPSGDTWNADFGLCLSMMMGHASALVASSAMKDMRIHNRRGSILPASREALVTQAQSWGASHLLFIDSDQTFPVETIEILLSRQKDVIGANIATKKIPCQPTARRKVSGDPKGAPVFTSDKSEGVEKVWRLGCGIMLINMKIFDKLKQPYFPITWNESLKDYTGEDWNFCTQLEEAGIDIYIDHDISKHVGHVGSFTYDHLWVDASQQFEAVK